MTVANPLTETAPLLKIFIHGYRILFVGGRAE